MLTDDALPFSGCTDIVSVFVPLLCARLAARSNLRILSMVMLSLLLERVCVIPFQNLLPIIFDRILSWAMNAGKRRAGCLATKSANAAASQEK